MCIRDSDVVDGRATQLGELVQLVAEHDILGAARPVDEGQVSPSRRQFLEQRPQRRDADAASDQKDSCLGPPGTGEDAIWPFDEDDGADPDFLELARVVAEILHGEAEVATVGRCRDRERVGTIPAVDGQEPQTEPLPSPDGETIQVAAGEVDRDDAGSFLDNVCDAHPMAHRYCDRLAEPEREAVSYTHLRAHETVLDL